MISREDLIAQSVMDYARAAITSRGYPPSQVEFLEAFPLEGFADRDFDRNFIAAGFNFDDTGSQAELGSNLLTRVYNIEFFVFGMTATYGRNLANVLKFALQMDQQIPLKDISQPHAPVIDQLDVIGTTAHRQPIADPEPWQQFVWLTTLHLQDVYFASLV